MNKLVFSMGGKELGVVDIPCSIDDDSLQSDGFIDERKMEITHSNSESLTIVAGDIGNSSASGKFKVLTADNKPHISKLTVELMR